MKRFAVFLFVTAIFIIAGCSSKQNGAGNISGVFNGTGQGVHGDVKVAVTLKNGKITDVSVVSHNETPNISDAAIQNIPKSIVKHQSLAVDTVSGATVTSKAILTAAEAALAESGANVAVFKNAVKKNAAKKKTVTKKADVVIVGAGGAGLAAAVSAKQAGASVIIVEKMPSVGGSTIISGGQYNAFDPGRQHKIQLRKGNLDAVNRFINTEPANDLHKELIEKVKAQLKEYKDSNATYTFDSAEFHALQTFEGGDRAGNLDLIYQLTQGAQESVGWLESIGVKVQEFVGMVTGSLWPRTHQFEKPLMTGPIEAYMAYLNGAKDCEILLSTKTDELIIKDGKVTGIKASSAADDYTISAAKGVVLATGGFARNPELIAKYDIHWGGLDGLGSTNHMGATGDGIIMAQAAGANLVGMEWIQLLPVGNPETGGMSGNISINAANQLFINLEGKRFVAEDERRDNLTRALLAQPERKMFILHDAHEYTSGDVKNDFNETIDELVAKGLVVKADTIRDLAEKMGVNPDNLVQSVEEYNKAVDGKIKDPLNKKVMDKRFDKAPFYAGIRVPTIHHTMGGVAIDKDARVLDTNGKAIPGLYAAGEVTGGIHGSNRLGGNALPDTVVFGKLAGVSAASAK